MLYKNRIVFFADILGFKSIIDSSYTTDEVEEVTGRIATALRRIPEFSDDTHLCELQNIDFQFTQFSDCFIISFACEEESQLFYTLLRGCPACFLILKGVVISSHETNRFS